MKKTITLLLAFGSYFFCAPVFSQNDQTPNSLGLPGDNFDLYGVLNIFQESKTLEEFEQRLNAEDSKVNNLDLDGDGKTDYIKVTDNISGSAHYIVLQDAINEKESQDVAVIEVEKDNNNQIQIQIIGDQLLYGKDYIVEPAGTPNPGYAGNISNSPGGGNTIVTNNYYNTNVVGSGPDYIYAVGSWSIIHFIFAPVYVVYVSPWRWGYYPSYWHPWYPMYYYDYYHHWHHHPSYGYFHKTHEYHVYNAHNHYGPMRTTSTVVNQRLERGDYKKTYNQTNSATKANSTQTQSSGQKNNNVQKKANNASPSAVKGPTAKPAAKSQNSTKANSSSRPVINNEAKPAPSPKPAENHAAKQSSSPKPAANNTSKQVSGPKPAVNNAAKTTSRPASPSSAKPGQSGRPKR
ncbi:MAG: hypothetical protein PHD97_03495 [Bacteroidales bacterium]|nr:hypothetical protein [Bacteroidales bacterium]